VINETSGKEEENTTALLDKLRCGLSETAYDNTISIGQLKCATDGGMVSELRNYIANLNTSGSFKYHQSQRLFKKPAQAAGGPFCSGSS